MKTMLSIMKKRKNGIPEDVLSIFESIVQTYGRNECDNRFMEAMGELLTEEQRFKLWEQNGACQGTGHDKVRKAFSFEHADKPLPLRLELYLNTFIKDYTGKTRNILLNEENNTIAITFACDECYRHTLKGNLQRLLSSIDIPQLGVSKDSPCIYTFDIVE
ncbi:hypothetical protein [Alkaliphilus transvaalensis]|uniref:hypothetical protein n=1 Tax=Alkaliphilus transvaalensis TaxID=114628 RepID=UPI0012EBF683|nr:hypothetical protein [Alkaliphilus transvaalensis]